ncbi:Receptor-like protein 1 [Glycine soja]
MIMNRKMKSTVGVCLLFLVLLEAMCCEGCWKEERDALLVLHSRFNSHSSWDGPDCCQWEGVECNSSTGRVAGLYLWSDGWPLQGTKLYINYSDFVVFKDLKNLDLSFTGISGCVGNEARLESLEFLDISGNYLDDAGILSCLDGLSSLKDIGLNISSFHVFETLSSKLRNLEVLDISFNYLTNDILPSLGGFTSLKELYLAGIHLDSDLHFQGNGGFTWPTGLQALDLRGNRLNNKFLPSLNGLECLKYLYLSSNQLEGSLHISGLSGSTSLEILDLSYNNISDFVVHQDWSKLKKLELLDLSGNKFEGPLPSSFVNMTSLRKLEISDNHFIGNFGSNIASLTSLEYFGFTDNQFEVPVSFTPFANHSKIKSIWGEGNRFILDSQHRSIPLELGELEYLTSLDLSQNNFIGLVPSFANSSVAFIHLNNNLLSGLSKRMFHGNSSLVMLDLSYNEISNNLKDLIHNLSYKRLNILLLKGNHFMGDIPKQLCQLIDLNMLDLSHNNFSGVIPKCLGKMPFENKNPKDLLARFSIFHPHLHILAAALPPSNVQEKVNFTTKERTDTYIGRVLVYMSGIDLSHNKLKGNIPFELGYLTKIRALNLSHNDLTGQIPVTFSLLAQTESLDLSFNMLNSQIPPQLSMLTSLEVFSVAHNNLSGPTPDFKGQFSTFDESSYEGNPFLCGPPLPKSCNPPPTIIPNDSNTDGDNDSLLDMYVFFVSFAVSYTSALLVTAAALYINPYWRQAWFYYMELVSMNCYYFIKDNLSKNLGLLFTGISGCVGNEARLENLEVLDISYNYLDDAGILSCLDGLSSLKSLYLTDNRLNISSFHGNGGFTWPTGLQALDLRGNRLNNKFLPSLNGLECLKYLYLSSNQLEGSLHISGLSGSTSLEILDLSYNNISDFVVHQDWSKLKKLELLDLSGNKFEGPLPSSFVNMTSLRKLEISDNHFIGNFGSNIASLTSLEYFGFTKNQFEVPVSFTPFANLSKIKFIYGEGNKILLDSQHSLLTWIPKFQLQELIVSSTIETKSFPLPNFLLYQNSLITLSFSSWKLEGHFPYWVLENNTQMMNVLFRNCSLTGTFQLPMRPLPNIRQIDVSDNIIVGQIPSNNISSIYPNLQFLNLSKNIIQGSIPRQLGQMNSLDSLDLSDNQLSGEIPEDIFGVGHQLNSLKLSNNMLEGPILNIPNGLMTLLLNNNRFTGRLQSNIFNASIISLDVSNNHLVGKIPSLIKNLSSLSKLYLSNNHFEGSIPLELGELEYLTYLDLSQNNFVGLVPSFVNSSVAFIHLNNNRLSGLSKRMFHGNSSLVMLDLSYNEISNNLQDLIHNLSYKRLNFLILKGNHFMGDIPKQLCQLIDLNMLDLSHNNFSGVIPKCLGKMPFENKNPKDLLARFSIFDPPDRHIVAPPPLTPILNEQEKANFTTKERTDTYMGRVRVYMSGIDLSHNKLKGNIPSELGYLTKIRALNLSHNDLTGQIPVTFSLLAQIESLDLSFNMLNSQIPPQLSMLTSLEVFSVAHNNLSGPTPDFKGQFSTFDESSYEGNPFLCGLPLPKSCNPPPTIIPNDSNTNGDNDSLLDMYVFCVSFAVPYTSALLVTAAALYINPYWRQAWFYYMELVSMN